MQFLKITFVLNFYFGETTTFNLSEKMAKLFLISSSVSQMLGIFPSLYTC